MRKMVTIIMAVVMTITMVVPITITNVSAATKSGTPEAFVDIAMLYKNCKSLSSVKSEMRARGYSVWEENNKNIKGQWCAWFVSNCAIQSGVINKKDGGLNAESLPVNVVKRGGTITFVDSAFYESQIRDYNSKIKTKALRKKNKAKYVNKSYAPKPGDIVIYDRNSNSNHAHVGIVRAKSTPKKVYTVEGNTTGGRVNGAKVVKNYKSGNLRIVAYVTPKYKSTSYTHTVEFGLNEGNGTFKTQTVRDGENFTIPSGKPERSGYTFKGWSLKRLVDQKWYVSDKGWVSASEIEKNKLSSKLYQPNDKLKVDSSWTKNGGANSNYRFYAQWEKVKEASKPSVAPKETTETKTAAVTHKIYFGLNEGSGSFEDMMATEGEQFTLPSAKPTKNNSTFKGWYVKRLKDDKWYYGSDLGWMNWDKAKAEGHSPKVYEPGRSMSFDSSWTKGCEGSNYKFYAQWQ